MSSFEQRESFLRRLYTGEQTSRPFAFTSEPAFKPLSDYGLTDYTLSDKPVTDWVPWFEENYRRRLRLAEALDDDTVPLARLNTGTHVFAQAFGCEVHIPEQSQPFALPLIHSAQEADQLTEPDIWSTPCLYRVFELADALQQRLGKDAWLAPCDMQTGFDIACLIWEKADCFCALMDPDQKEAVKRLAAKSGRLLSTFLKELQNEFPQMTLCGCPTVWTPPELGPWPSNDECGAVNTATFEEFMLPELVELSEQFGSVGMHCCADADHQFPSFQTIPNFYAFNRVLPPGAHLDGFEPALRQLGGPDGPVFVFFEGGEDLVRCVASDAPAGTRAIFKINNVEDIEAARDHLNQVRQIARTNHEYAT